MATLEAVLRYVPDDGGVVQLGKTSDPATICTLGDRLLEEAADRVRGQGEDEGRRLIAGVEVKRLATLLELLKGPEPVANADPQLKLIQGAKKGRTMSSKSAIETIDQAVAEMLRADPKLTKQKALRQLGAKHPELFEQHRQEGLDKSASGRQAFAEAQSRCRTLGGGSTALAAASRVVENAESVRGAEPTPAPATRTMQEIHRAIAEEKRRDPRLTDAEARKRYFGANPGAYEHYRRSTTRTTRRGQ